MKLEVGQFARLKSGYIVKVLNVKDNWIETDTKFITRTFPKDFVKASYNIIDILEVGDYANGYYISKIWEKDEITHYVNETPIKRKEREIVIQAPSYGGIEILKNKNIKSVITHEQIEQMEYNVKK